MTKYSLKTFNVLSLLFYRPFIKKVHCVIIIKKESVLAWKQEITEFHNIFIVLKTEDFWNFHKLINNS